MKNQKIHTRIFDLFLAVPVRIKIIGIMIIPVFILGVALNYWVRTGLSDWLSYLLSDERVKVAMQAGSRSVLLVSIIAAAGAILLTLLLMFLLTHPLMELRSTAHKVINGELDSRAYVYTEDEIGEVARAVNTMIDHLVDSNISLMKANRRLQALNDVLILSNRALDIHDMLFLILQNFIQLLKIESGWIYLLDPERVKFHLATWYGVPDELKEKLLHNPGDARCSCQEKLLEGSLDQRAQIRQCSRLTMGLGGEASLKHMTIKLEARGNLFGVINLLCKEDCIPSKEDLELLSLAASQVSELVANAWLFLKLTEKEVARQALLNALVKAQEDERSRLARELHDGAGQNLTSLLVRLKTIEKQVEHDEVRSSIEELCDNVSETIESIRKLSYQLRPIILEEMGLEVALRTLIDEMFNREEIQTKFECNLGEVTLPYEIETTLYRVTQEALTNIVRHAHASQVKVELSWSSNSTYLQVSDDGIGFDVEKITSDSNRQRLGLLNMNERIEILGGTMDVFSAPGSGTTIRVRLPLGGITKK